MQKKGKDIVVTAVPARKTLKKLENPNFHVSTKHHTGRRKEKNKCRNRTFQHKQVKKNKIGLYMHASGES